jgi:hypothetical protein
MSSTIPPRRDPSPHDGPTGDAGDGKEQYSLDEMMKALRDKEREKEAQGEMVTRADGSLVRKVKRRKRRTDQPASASPEKAKKSIIAKILIAASLCLLLVLAAISVLLYYNSKSYREKAEQATNEWIGAQTNFNGLKLWPSSVKMNEASFSWGGNSFVRSLQLKRLQGHVSLVSFLGARMGGVEVGGALGEVLLGMPVGRRGEIVQALEEDEFPFSFDRYYCDALNVVFGQESSLALRDTSVSLRHMGQQGFRIGIDEGTLLLRGWEPLPIANAIMRVEANELLIQPLTLELPIDNLQTLNASIKIQGGISLEEGESSEMDVEVSNFPASKLFGIQLGQLFDGEIKSSNEGKLVYKMGEDFPAELNLEFRGYQFELKKFPFLKALQEVFPNEGYDRIFFDTEIEGALKIRPEGVALETFKMSQKDILRLSGSVVASAQGELVGKMTLLINRGLINSEPRLKSLPGLSEIEKGYSRVDFEIGGTVAEPEDSFRIVTGLEATLPGQRPIIEETSEDLLDQLTKPKVTDSPTSE